MPVCCVWALFLFLLTRRSQGQQQAETHSYILSVASVTHSLRNLTKWDSQLGVSVPMQGVQPIIPCRQREV